MSSSHSTLQVINTPGKQKYDILSRFDGMVEKFEKELDIAKEMTCEVYYDAEGDSRAAREENEELQEKNRGLESAVKQMSKRMLKACSPHRPRCLVDFERVFNPQCSCKNCRRPLGDAGNT